MRVEERSAMGFTEEDLNDEKDYVVGRFLPYMKREKRLDTSVVKEFRYDEAEIMHANEMLVGKPAKMEHLDKEEDNMPRVDVGTIVATSLDNLSAYCLMELDSNENAESAWAARMVNQNKYKDVSLGHLPVEEIRGPYRERVIIKIPEEVSLCEEGKRPGSQIVQYWPSRQTLNRSDKRELASAETRLGRTFDLDRYEKIGRGAYISEMMGVVRRDRATALKKEGFLGGSSLQRVQASSRIRLMDGAAQQTEAATVAAPDASATVVQVPVVEKSASAPPPADASTNKAHETREAGVYVGGGSQGVEVPATVSDVLDSKKMAELAVKHAEAAQVALKERDELTKKLADYETRFVALEDSRKAAETAVKEAEQARIKAADDKRRERAKASLESFHEFVAPSYKGKEEIAKFEAYKKAQYSLLDTNPDLVETLVDDAKRLHIKASKAKEEADVLRRERVIEEGAMKMMNTDRENWEYAKGVQQRLYNARFRPDEVVAPPAEPAATSTAVPEVAPVVPDAPPAATEEAAPPKMESRIPAIPGSETMDTSAPPPQTAAAQHPRGLVIQASNPTTSGWEANDRRMLKAFFGREPTRDEVRYGVVPHPTGRVKASTKGTANEEPEMEFGPSRQNPVELSPDGWNADGFAELMRVAAARPQMMMTDGEYRGPTGITDWRRL